MANKGQHKATAGQCRPTKSHISRHRVASGQHRPMKTNESPQLPVANASQWRPRNPTAVSRDRPRYVFIPFYSFILLLICYMSHTIFTCPFFFDWSFVLLFWLALDFVMPKHLLCFPYSVTYNLRHSILHPPSLVHLPSPVTSSLHHLHSRHSSSVTLSSLLSISLSSNSSPLCSGLFLSFQHLFITPCLPILTLSTLHSLHSPSYSKPCSL